MALRRRGKKGFWHAYFRTVTATADGKLKYATTTINLGTTDKRTAAALEAELMAKNAAARQHQRATAHLIRLDVAAGRRPVEDLSVITKEKRRRRLKLADGIETAAKYKQIGDSAVKRWKAFVKVCRAAGYIYMDEITADFAFGYLNGKSPTGSSGKNFNNIKSALNAIFKLTLLDAGLDDSPFTKIPNRKLTSRHQRPFTEDEFIRIYNAAPEPWKSAAFIAYFTGLRQKDVFTLEWRQIDGDLIVTTPAKTARFGRAVRIPIHPQLAKVLAALPRVGDRILGAWPYDPADISFRRAFGNLLRQLDIRDNDRGFVAFNSLRDSFVTRCDEANIPRHAVRGMVGHVSDEQTDLYSHDLASARLVQQLPDVNLDCLDKIGIKTKK